MRLVEFDGKVLLQRYGIATPGGRKLFSPESAVAEEEAVVIKAQTLDGGRGKRGLIKNTDFGVAETVETVRGLMRAQGLAAWTMIEQRVTVTKEYYLALTFDDVRRCPCLLFSTHGGVDVEDNATNVKILPINPLRGLFQYEVVRFLAPLGIKGTELSRLARTASVLWTAYQAEDAELIEINPLGITADGETIALDAKVILEDNAHYRHDRGGLLSARLEREALTDLERRAEDMDCTFVELGGDIAVLSGGAGLGMTILDLLADSGYRAANFLDAPGGGPGRYKAKAKLVFERAARDDVKAIIVYHINSAQSLAVSVQGLIDTLAEMPAPKPLCAGFVASGAAERDLSMAEAQALLAKHGVRAVSELSELIDWLDATVGPLKTVPPKHSASESSPTQQ